MRVFREVKKVLTKKMAFEQGSERNEQAKGGGIWEARIVGKGPEKKTAKCAQSYEQQEIEWANLTIKP